MGKKRRIKENVSPVVKNTEEPVTTNMEKAEVLNNICLPQFSMVIFLPTSLKPQNFKAGTGGMKAPPL